MKKYEFLSKEPREMNYALFCPQEPIDGLPLIVYLHGAGERGKNISHLARHGIPKLLHEGFSLNAVVLCPQCPADCVWDNIPHQLKTLIDNVAESYRVDKDKISITGSSMGGFGTWMLGMAYPNDFAAIAPVAGGGMEWRASNLRATPVRAYHGEKDKVVFALRTKMMIEKIQACGGNAEGIFFAELGHNDGIDFAYRNTDLLAWLLAQKKQPREHIKENSSEFF